MSRSPGEGIIVSCGDAPESGGGMTRGMEMRYGIRETQQTVVLEIEIPQARERSANAWGVFANRFLLARVI